MQAPPPAAERRALDILGIAVVVAIALGGFLLVRAFHAPSQARFSVGTPAGTACPSGTGAPACFQVLVRNVGGHPGDVLCHVTPAAGTTALFLAGSSTYTSGAPIPADGSIALFLKVDASGGDSLFAPSVACADAGSG